MPTSATAACMLFMSTSRSARWTVSADAALGAVMSAAILPTTANRSAPGVLPNASRPVRSTRIFSVSDTRRVTCALVVAQPGAGRRVVGLAAGGDAAEQRTSLDLEVGQGQQAVPQGRHLGGEGLLGDVGRRAGVQALDGQVPDPARRGEHGLQRRVGLLEPVLRVGEVAGLLRDGGLVATRLHRPVGAGRRVGRRTDEPAGGELLLQLADGVEVAVEALEAGERDGALGDPHSDHSPTRPVRLISLSSVSSIAVTSRPAAE